MASDRIVVREIAWREILPWLVIFRTFRLARSLSLLFLATFGVLLTPVGWRLGEALFVSDQLVEQDAPFARLLEQNRQWPFQRSAIPVPNDGRLPRSVQEIVVTKPNTLEPIYLRFVDPLARLLDAPLTLTQAAYWAFGLLWMLAVWAFFGGAITRVAVVQLGREERLGLGDAVRHAGVRLGAYCGAPLFPMAGVVLVALPICGLGLLARWDGGLLAAGIVWIPALLGGLVIAVLLLGLLFGWPLMWGTISAEERGDVFEAFSRSYSYAFQRPLHYLFYAVLATVYGALAWLLVYHFAESIIRFAEWAAALGAGSERWADIVQLRGDPSLGGGLTRYGGLLMDLGSGFVRSIAAGFGYSLFWCLAAAVYLLLRRDVDQTEFDEVFVANESQRYQLPEVRGSEKAEEWQSGKVEK